MKHLTQQNLYTLFASTTQQEHIDAMDAYNATREPSRHVRFAERRSPLGSLIDVIVLRDELPDELAVVLEFADVRDLAFSGLAA